MLTSDDDVGIIIGIVMGILFCILVIVLVLVIFFKKRSTRRSNSPKSGTYMIAESDSPGKDGGETPPRPHDDLEIDTTEATPSRPGEVSV